MKSLLVSLMFCLTLLGCGGGDSFCGIGSTGCGGGDTQTSVASAGTEIKWQLDGQTLGAKGNYTAIVHDGAVLRVFSNFKGGTLLNLFDDELTKEAKLYQWTGTWQGVGDLKTVVDLPDQFIRTIGIQRSATGKCYGLLRVGTSYGGGGYFPSWFESDTKCENWTQVAAKVWGGTGDGFNTLTLNEAAGSVVDSANPRNNRYTALGDGLGRKIGLAYSANGVDWLFDARELAPAELAGINSTFATEVRTPFGYHMIVADWDGSKATRHLHLYSCDGISYRVLDTAAPTFNGPKGTAMLYEQSTGLVHTLTNGKHLTFQAEQLACASK